MRTRGSFLVSYKFLTRSHGANGEGSDNVYPLLTACFTKVKLLCSPPNYVANLLYLRFHFRKGTKASERLSNLPRNTELVSSSVCTET